MMIGWERVSRASAAPFLVGLLAAGPAPAADLVVVESHVGARPAGTDARLAAVVETLGDRVLH